MITQVALAMGLLICASLTIRSFFNLTKVEPGFRAENVLTAKLMLPTARYMNTAQVLAFSDAVFERLRSLPQIIAVGSVDGLPLSGADQGFLWLDAAGKVSACNARVFNVGGDYFRAMGILLARGRWFSQQDSANGQKVVVVKEVLARQVWGSRSPVGQALTIEGEERPRTVVGVVGDVKSTNLADSSEPQLYLPINQPYREFATRYMVLVVRSSSSPQWMSNALPSLVSGIDKSVPVSRVQSLEEVVAGSVGPVKLRSLLLGLFAFVAFTLATLGVYGLVDYVITDKTHEFAVRMVFGAQQRQLCMSVLMEGIKSALIGIIIGTVLSFWLTRLISSLLFGVGPTDPQIFVLSCLSVLVVVVSASVVAAMRAMRIEPAQALRYE